MQPRLLFSILLISWTCSAQPMPTSVTLSKPKIAASPKVAAQKISWGMAMAKAIVTETNPPDVFQVSLGWTSAIVPDSFKLYIGSQPGVYTNFIPVTSSNAVVFGTSNCFTITKTNWPDESVQHFYAVTALRGTNESGYSPECHYPFNPPDHFALTWNTNWPSVAIQQAPTLYGPWTPYVTVTGTNYFATNIVTQGNCFFRLNKRDMLAIVTFNPNP